MYLYLQKPANILVMGEGAERGRVKIGLYDFNYVTSLAKLIHFGMQSGYYKHCAVSAVVQV